MANLSWLGKSALYAGAFVAISVSSSLSVRAASVDLTTANSSGAINGVWFYQQSGDFSTGTGVFNPFLRLNAQGNDTTSQGYNTSGTQEFDEDTWAKDLAISSIPIVGVPGNQYYQFVLDINEPAAANQKLLSLDSVQLFGTDTAALTGYPFTGNATKVYDMDFGSDSEVLLDYSLVGTGSGRYDMAMYVPKNLLDTYTYVILYAEFGNKGGSYAEQDGFEEWATELEADRYLSTRSNWSATSTTACGFVASHQCAEFDWIIWMA